MGKQIQFLLDVALGLSLFVWGGTAVVYSQTRPAYPSMVQMTTPQELYVNGSTGSDSNNCLAAVAASGNAPCASLVKGLATAFKYYMNGLTVFVNVAAGTYDGAVLISGPGFGTGGANSPGVTLGYLIPYIQINGAGATTIIDSLPSDITYSCGTLTLTGGAYVLLTNLKIQQSASGNCNSGGVPSSAIFLQDQAYLAIGVGVTFGATTGQHMHAEESSVIEITAPYTIAGGALDHEAVGSTSIIANDGETVTCSGNYNFSGGFLNIEDGGIAQFLPTTTFSGCGSTTGPKFQLATGGIIDGADISGFYAALPGATTTNIRYPGTTFYPMPKPALGTCANGTLNTNSTDDLMNVTFSGSNSSCAITFAIPFQTGSVCTANASVNTAAVGVVSTTTTVTIATTLGNTNSLNISCHPFPN